MASKLLSYLQKISGNTADLQLFHSNPAEAAKKAGLNAKETAALISKSPGALANVIKTEGGNGTAAADGDINVTVVLVVAP